MVKVKDIVRLIETAAPTALAEEWDNPGLAVGDENAEVKAVLTALDCDMDVVLEAEKRGCNMIVTHHPLIFHPLSFVTNDSETGRVVLALAERKIALFSAHTNLDCAKGGTNDFLCEKLGLRNVEICDSVGGGNLVRIGKTTKKRFGDFAAEIAECFGKKYIRCVGDKNKIVEKIGVCSGGGGEYIPDMAGLCDVYITGDVKYHAARSAKEEGLCLALLEHYESEICVNEIFAKILNNAGVPVVRSEANTDVMFDIFSESEK